MTGPDGGGGTEQPTQSAAAANQKRIGTPFLAPQIRRMVRAGPTCQQVWSRCWRRFGFLRMKRGLEGVEQPLVLFRGPDRDAHAVGERSLSKQSHHHAALG